ncbi:MAG: hypothetical protein F6K58_15010 [Symploca sp. SIO2E9]|nr:hypothetical protein [Symploca sp. SIO2E9]
MTNNNTNYGPDPCNPYPLKDYKGLCYLKNIVKNPNIIDSSLLARASQLVSQITGISIPI